MPTIVTQQKDLVGVESLTFVRAQTIILTVTDARPNTRLYPFFDGTPIDKYCRAYLGENNTAIGVADVQPNKPAGNVTFPTPAGLTNNSGQYILLTKTVSIAGSTAGHGSTTTAPIGLGMLMPANSLGTSSSVFSDFSAPIYTNASGEAQVAFNVPSGTFLTGPREVVLSDTPNLSDLSVAGNTYGAARAIFNSNGRLETYQTTQTTTNVTVYSPPPPPRLGDPLAQSFFTYGTTGGMFLTSIGLFFYSKDATVPVRVEIRELVNGSPSPLKAEQANFVCSLNPSAVSISDNASAETRFTFINPIYIPEDRDYCFVVLTNSSAYQLWSSKMGEVAIENGRTIFKQPYVGSMFKSENNVTWTAEQFEDIKFNMYKAQFDTTVTGELLMTTEVDPVSIPGTNFSTKNGSSIVTVKTPQMHGFIQGSNAKFQLFATSATGVYNGIPAASLRGVMTVTNVIDEYTFQFNAGVNATSTGKITWGGSVSDIIMTSGGSGYVSPVVTIGDPTTGTTATATPTVVNGVITKISVTNAGSGYKANPLVLISDASGSGASAIAVTEAQFLLTLNKPVDIITPQYATQVFPSTSMKTTITLANDSYAYTAEEELSMEKATYFHDKKMIASKQNEIANMASGNSMLIRTRFSTQNPNVSPVIDLRNNPGIIAYNNAVNAQGFNESLTSTNAYGTVASVTVTAAGLGYTGSTVACTVTPADNDSNADNIVPAVVNANITGGSVSSFTVVNPGSGYTKLPLVTVPPPTTGTQATGVAVLSAFNSEVKTSGTAFSRYITKKIVLNFASTGMRVLVLASSTPFSTFDWYIRTSLSTSGVRHEDGVWNIMTCDVARNRSADRSEFYEYEFRLDNLPAFDTYDLKMVPSSTNRAIVPFIRRYRTIALV